MRSPISKLTSPAPGWAPAGVAQVDVDGVTVAAFEHWFNRSGDPQLHTHLAVSAMVRTAGSGRWRRLDSRAMYRAAASVGERYTGYLLGRLRDESGGLRPPPSGPR